MHTIEIDDQVFEFLKKKAEPLVDTPNSVLRRELLGRELRRPALTQVGMGTARIEDAGSHVGLPQALRQIFEVITLVKIGKLDRKEATAEVARRHHVRIQTVNDKYGRQLEIDARQFDQLLLKDDFGGLEKTILQKFPNHHDEINRFFASLRSRPTT